MMARPCVWLDPKGGMIARAVCPGLYVFCKLVVDRYTGCRVRDIGCWLLRHSNNNNNNNNVHNIIGMNRDDAAVVKSESSRTVC